MQTGQGALLIKGQPQDMVSSLEEILSFKSKKCGLSVQCKVGVQANGKYHIRANLDQRFIDRLIFPQSVP